MQPSKLIGALAAVGIALLALGALVTLLTETFGTGQAIATTALVAVLVVAASALGARSREWLAGPYW